MNSKAVKVGIISEPMAISHLEYCLNSLANCEGIDRIAVADASGEAFEEAASLLGRYADNLSTFRSDTEMLGTFKPELVFVSLEAHHAPGPIEAALEAGCHVVSEKPACVRISDFEHLVKVANRRQRHLMLVFANRLLPQVQKAKELVQSGLLGDFYGTEIHTIADQTRLKSPEYQNSWYASKEKAGGGHLTWLGVHYLDLIQFITGLRIQQVCGFVANVGGQPIEVEDSAVLSLRFENGTLGTMQSAYYLERDYHSQILIWGSLGWLKLSGGGTFESDLEWLSNHEESPKGVQTLPYTPESKSTAGVETLMQAAVDMAAGGGAPPMTAEECLYVLKLVSGLYTSARDGVAVTVSSSVIGL